jgi:hypothetical protein
MWIELPQQTVAKLNRVAREARREPREQAAYFVERELARVGSDAERAEADEPLTAA